MPLFSLPNHLVPISENSVRRRIAARRLRSEQVHSVRSRVASEHSLNIYLYGK
jgi:hypothetical protein